MIDLIVTWPKNRAFSSYLFELKRAEAEGLAINYHVHRPPQIPAGEKLGRCYIVHDGFVRGYNEIDGIVHRGPSEVVDPTTGEFWPEGWYIVRDPKWHPIPNHRQPPMPGFRGFRYFKGER